MGSHFPSVPILCIKEVIPVTLQETAFPDDPGGSKVEFGSLWLFCASYAQDVSRGVAMACAVVFAEVWVLYLACRLFLQSCPF